jgi:hypothetical protein
MRTQRHDLRILPCPRANGALNIGG